MAKAGDQYAFRTGNIWNYANRDDVKTVSRPLVIPVFIEIFSGSARFAHAVARAAGWLAMKWDILDGADYDLMRPAVQRLLKGVVAGRPNTRVSHGLSMCIVVAGPGLS